MIRKRLLFTTILFVFLFATCGALTFAQRPGPQFWRRLSCEPIEPRTKLEAFDDRY